MHAEARDSSDTIAARRDMMRTLAQAPEAELAQAVAALGALPVYIDVRKPEVGLVMLRGRIGGDGAPFNVGEATVTRAVVRLETGETGFSYVLGRAPEKARLAAIVDALWLDGRERARVEALVLAPLRRLQRERAARTAAETAATRVDFFTLVRGEDK